MTITRDEWLSALREAEGDEPNDPSLLTACEYADLIGVCATTARAHLRRLVAGGKAVRLSKRIRGIDNKRRIVPAWRLKAKKG